MPDTNERLDRIEKQLDLLAAQVARNFAILEKALKEHVESVVKEHAQKKK
jgi:hypothetical protein